VSSGAVAALAHKPSFGILRCPVCRRDLSPVGRALVCEHGHNFDLARSGYVNLLAGRGRRPASGGDSGAQLQHRDAFLASAHFDFIGDAILQQAGAMTRATSASRLHILDAGCGTGYHLARIARGTGARSYGLGLDLSKAAARIASLHFRDLAFAVADIWADWPVRSGSVELLINVVAPKNFAEMARVLTADGLLAVAYPGEQHLVELHREFGLMGMRKGKSRHYGDTLQRFFGEIRLERFRRRSALDPKDVMNAICMGPSATRVPGKTVVPAGTRTVTFEIEILFARRPVRADANVSA
jgi:23S rRNA (guanine745-N1)-methyltransferase